MTKKLILLISPLLLVIISISILFYPLINLKSSVKTQPGYNTTDFVVNNWNPFKPRITTIIKLSGENGFLIEVSDFSRTGLFEFTSLNELDGEKKPIDFGRFNDKIMNKSVEEVKKIAQNQDLSQKPYQIEKTTVEIDYEKEKQKPVECQRVLQDQKSYSDSFLSKINKNTLLLDFLKQRLITGEEFKNLDGIYFLSVNSNLNNIVKFNIYSSQKTYDQDPQVKISKVTKVYSDCREEEIPLSDAPLN